MKLYHINLTEEEREELVRGTTTGRRAARKVMRARILLKADEGLKDEQIAEHLNVTVRTIKFVRKKCALEGIEATLTPKKRPPGKQKLDGEDEAKLVQIACSAPPDGRQRWALRLRAISRPTRFFINLNNHVMILLVTIKRGAPNETGVRMIKSIISFLVLGLLFLSIGCDEEDKQVVEREDNAEQLTFSEDGQSSQNPAFSPDGKHILFTRFLDGYNGVPSELVRIEISTGEETIVIPASGEVENTSVPGTAWVDGKICWSSDAAGKSNEIYIANDDGTEIEQVTEHPESEGYYIEPVFNPQDVNKIIFEYGQSDEYLHQIAIVEMDEDNRVTILSEGTDFDDRLPNWSWDGTTILFQRADAGDENWRIYTASIDYSGAEPALDDVYLMDQPDEDNTDNSWYADNGHVLSSTYYESDMPNIFAFPDDGAPSIRITETSTNEDGAPTSSPDGNWISFESHYGEEEEFPSDIWIIEAPLSLQRRF